jgi:putative endonuclease
VAARISQHERGVGARYTRGRGPFTLLGKLRCASKGDALRLEHAFKQLSRTRKLAVLARPRGLSRFWRTVLPSGPK